MEEADFTSRSKGKSCRTRYPPAGNGVNRHRSVGPLVDAHTRLPTSRLLAEEVEYLRPSQRLAEHDRTARISAVRLENHLGQVQPDRATAELAMIFFLRRGEL
jgi:hypothetical protein